MHIYKLIKGIVYIHRETYYDHKPLHAVEKLGEGKVKNYTHK